MKKLVLGILTMCVVGCGMEQDPPDPTPPSTPAPVAKKCPSNNFVSGTAIKTKVVTNVGYCINLIGLPPATIDVISGLSSLGTLTNVGTMVESNICVITFNLNQRADNSHEVNYAIASCSGSSALNYNICIATVPTAQSCARDVYYQLTVPAI